MYFGPFFRGQGERPMTWEHMRGIAQHSYGDPDSLDPYGGYKGKAAAAFFHIKHSVMKDCLSADDFIFPLQFSLNSEDRFCRIGDIDGPSVDYHLFRAGTGTPWTEQEFDDAALRVYTLERALNVRHWGRDRSMDGIVLQSFEYPENWVNPLLGERYALDREQFRPVADQYYSLLGWDLDRAWPTPERLGALGLGDVYEPMVAGAAQAEVPPIAEPGPVPQVEHVL
jgi:aldehyde:ferredoxin oxidoreductase